MKVIIFNMHDRNVSTQPEFFDLRQQPSYYDVILYNLAEYLDGLRAAEECDEAVLHDIFTLTTLILTHG